VSVLWFLCTTSTCRLPGVRTISGILLWVHARTLVYRTWLPMTSRLPLGWVSCFQPCHSVCNTSACCIFQPRTVPSQSIVPRRSVWLYLRPRCILARILCILGMYVSCSLVSRPVHSQGCLSAQGPSESRLLCRSCRRRP